MKSVGKIDENQLFELAPHLHVGENRNFLASRLTCEYLGLQMCVCRRRRQFGLWQVLVTDHLAICVTAVVPIYVRLERFLNSMLRQQYRPSCCLATATAHKPSSSSISDISVHPRGMQVKTSHHGKLAYTLPLLLQTYFLAPIRTPAIK